MTDRHFPVHPNLRQLRRQAKGTLSGVGACVLVRDADEMQVDHRRTDREGDGRDVTEHADQVGSLPLLRNDGVESVMGAGS